jgi:hypothetical protein
MRAKKVNEKGVLARPFPVWKKEEEKKLQLLKKRTS